MKPDELRSLLNRYYEGETTEEEETVLKTFFNNPDIPVEYSTEKEIFSYFKKLNQIPEPSDDFENRIIAAVDKLNFSLGRNNRRLFRILTGVAAGILIMTGSYFFFVNSSKPRDTYSDPEIAYAETLKILHSVSDRMNDGTKALERLGSIREVTVESLKTIDRSASEITKPLEIIGKVLEQMDENDEKN